jgi:hypothetical protein
LRGVQLFLKSTIFPKQTKWRKGILNTTVKWTFSWGRLLRYLKKTRKPIPEKNTAIVFYLILCKIFLNYLMQNFLFLNDVKQTRYNSFD